MTTAKHIEAVCQELSDFLLEKNRKYGDSAISPVRIFSHADPLEQIDVRIDDKLSRIQSRQGDDDDEDVELDLLGYLILKRVAKRMETKFSKGGGGIKDAEKPVKVSGVPYEVEIPATDKNSAELNTGRQRRYLKDPGEYDERRE